MFHSCIEDYFTRLLISWRQLPRLKKPTLFLIQSNFYLFIFWNIVFKLFIFIYILYVFIWFFLDQNDFFWIKHKRILFLYFSNFSSASLAIAIIFSCHFYIIYCNVNIIYLLIISDYLLAGKYDCKYWLGFLWKCSVLWWVVCTLLF